MGPGHGIAAEEAGAGFPSKRPCIVLLSSPPLLFSSHLLLSSSPRLLLVHAHTRSLCLVGVAACPETPASDPRSEPRYGPRPPRTAEATGRVPRILPVAEVLHTASSAGDGPPAPRPCHSSRPPASPADCRVPRLVAVSRGRQQQQLPPHKRLGLRRRLRHHVRPEPANQRLSTYSGPTSFPVRRRDSTECGNARPADPAPVIGRLCFNQEPSSTSAYKRNLFRPSAPGGTNALRNDRPEIRSPSPSSDAPKPRLPPLHKPVCDCASDWPMPKSSLRDSTIRYE
ncbi:hypothetical protein CDD83_1364 [Cordyceps sp. RAO-2017]|nr:hypothetical protein CDD83_1364 [Cordyceps sp. RAO-2017]